MAFVDEKLPSDTYQMGSWSSNAPRQMLNIWSDIEIIIQAFEAKSMSLSALLSKGWVAHVLPAFLFRLSRD